MFSSEINWSEGFPNMVLSTEYSEAVNERYTFQPLWVSDNIYNIFKTSPICVNEVKYLRQVLYVCHELYKCSKKVLRICKMLCLFENKLDISTFSCIYMKQVLHIKKKSYILRNYYKY